MEPDKDVEWLRVALCAVAVVGLACAKPPAQVFEMVPSVKPEQPVAISPNSGDDEDPSVLLAQDGRLYVVWSEKRDGRVDLVMRDSEDGRQWSPLRYVTRDAVQDFYPSLMQSRAGSFHLVWFRIQANSNPMDLWYARSPDGVRWTSPERITTHPAKDWAPTIYQDDAGAIWIVWSSDREGNRELFAKRSRNNGRDWSTSYRLTESSEEDDFPHVHVLAGGERILVWTRYQPGSALLSYYKDASGEVVTARSGDGLRWSEPEPVSPPDPIAQYLDFLPFVFSHPTNRPFVSWTSTRVRITKGDILLRELEPNAPVKRLTQELGGYSAKIARTPEPNEYLMVWVSRGNGLDIFTRRFVLPGP